jgi:hypothetical protein
MSRLSRLTALFALLTAAVALAACGSSGKDSSSSAASTTSTTASGSGPNGGNRQAAFQKFTQCLKDNGVTLPNRRPGGQGQGGGQGYGPPPGAGTSTNGAPPTGGRGRGGFFGGQSNDPKIQKAMQACAKYRPQFNGGGRNGGGRAQFDIKAFTPYLTCLKDQGLDVKVSDGFNALRNLKRDDAKVQAAFKACQSKLPRRPQGQGGGGSSAAPSNTTTNGQT